MTGATTAVWVVTFWSYAELQFFPVLSRSLNWRLYAAQSFDCTFVDKTGLEIRFFDLARFFERASLARVAESFGEKKIEYNVENVTKKTLRDPKFREYALHDARLCYTILQKMRAEFLPLGADPLISKTAAGVSATVFRYNYIREKTRCYIPKARLAGMYSCWGGRAEVFGRGKFAQVYEYDLDSAYPNAAIEIGRFPANDDLREVDVLRGIGLAHVRFVFPESTRFPCLPCIVDDCQVYPLSGISWATSFEIERARELGAHIETLEAWTYSRGSTALADMMSWALELRKTATGARNVAAKLIANAMIGKLAQRRSGIDIDEIRKLCKLSGVSIHDVIRLNTHELESLGLKREARIGACFMPEWNALITGLVRAKLNRLLYASTPVYCATDSVWSTTKVASQAGLTLKRAGPAIVVRTRLAGLFDPEKEHIAHHSIWKRDAARELLKTFDTTPLIKYRLSRPVKLRESLRRKIRLATFIEELREGSASWDHKRQLQEDGSTLPWPTVDEYARAREQ